MHRSLPKAIAVKCMVCGQHRVLADGWELNLQVWGVGEQTHEVIVTGTQQTLVADVERAVALVPDRLPNAPSKKINVVFPATRHKVDKAGRENPTPNFSHQHTSEQGAEANTLPASE